jgi:colanic acid/amylovoran biosynthesis protein
MIIEIKGTGNQNKGAEMMLLTVLQQLSQKNLKFAYAPLVRSDQYAFYSKLGLYPKLWLRYKGFQLGKLGKLIPKTLRSMYGIVIDEEVDAILDASGFAYSDQWGTVFTKVMAQETGQWKKAGKKIILLPQAFGPFDKADIRQYMAEIINNCDLIYARDPFSYKELVKITETEKIKLSPDFTMLLEGVKPDYFDKKKHQVCIVPNKRVVDKTQEGKSYGSVFVKVINHLASNGLTPFFLIHGGAEDHAIALEINKQLSQPIEIINEEDPILIKGIIKESVGLVGSRFHSLASALYSGTIAVGMGWSHKYKYLFDELGFSEGLIGLNEPDDSLYAALEYIIDAQKRACQQDRILTNVALQKEKTVEMFKEVKHCLSL